MENINITGIPLILWAINLLTILVAWLMGFWSRKGDHFVNKLQLFKWGRFEKSWGASVTFIDVIFLLAVAAILSLLIHNGNLIAVLSILGLLLTLIFIPRFLIDITKGLKMNHSTGDLDRINKLQEELDKLKKKVG